MALRILRFTARSRAGGVLVGVFASLTSLAPETYLRAQSPPPVVTDSAGVEIVVSSAPAWDEASQWTVRTEPSLRVGRIEGDPAYLFGDVVDAVRLADGRIFVADRQAQQVRVFDPRGRHLRTLGRTGDGPGEFRRLSDLSSLPGDSVAAWDRQHGRLTILTPDGELARVARTSWDRFNTLGGLHHLGDRRFVMTGSLSSYYVEDRPSGTIERPATSVHVIDAEGAIRTFGSFPGLEIGFHGTGFGRPPFGRSITVSAREGVVYVGTQETLEYRAYSPEGRLLRIVRGPREDLVVDEGLRDAYWDYRRRRAILETPEQRREFADRVAATPFPPTRAAFSRLLVDSGGNVWVEHAPSREDLDPRSWRVFDPSGALLGLVRLPDRFRALEIGDDYVLGIWRDDLWVPYVQLHELVKPAKDGTGAGG